MQMNSTKKIIIAITGASGSVYAKNLLERLHKLIPVPEISVIFSEEGKKVWNYELSDSDFNYNNVKIFRHNDFFAAPASGSANYKSMVIIPCSMGTLGKIASGSSDNLIIRAADVMLKEKRKLIIVPREMPLNLIHIRNMETLLLAGAQIIPASPAFYRHPETIEELLNTVTDKVLSSIGFNENNFEWGKTIS
jgi:flavin prenyltransferase